tara:strand:- start:14316 stop:14561 length:246 start_codon:yes stop_codon:yes gene_type:complete
MKVQCVVCKKEIVSNGKPQNCGCQNNLIVDDKGFTAMDLSAVIILNNVTNVSEPRQFSQDQVEWLEKRRKRKVRKLNFEER